MERIKVKDFDMGLPSDHFIDMIHKNANKINSYLHEGCLVKLAYSPETSSPCFIEIFPFGSLRNTDNIKEIPGDVENFIQQNSPHPQLQVPENPQSHSRTKKTSKQKSLLYENLHLLTFKQISALLLFSLQLSNRQAAKYIGISEPTYREHLKTALKKLYTLSPHNA